ncbi:MAG: hypothetical protein KY452_02465 [Actinobacteria bacterium]|nr:hypothetical protein [Actinomycetota bacterium]
MWFRLPGRTHGQERRRRHGAGDAQTHAENHHGGGHGGEGNGALPSGETERVQDRTVGPRPLELAGDRGAQGDQAGGGGHAGKDQ